MTQRTQQTFRPKRTRLDKPMKLTRFEDIKAWQEARALVKLVYDAVRAND